jgi:hypothetical protein
VAADDLQNLAVAVKDAALVILDGNGNEPIVREFVSHGPPALDCCNQLAVHVAQIGEAATQTGNVLQAGLRHNAARVNLTTLLTTVTRCHPVLEDDGNPPTAAELTAAAAMLNADAWSLWNGLYRAQDDLFSACDLVFFDGIVPLPPQGGCAGYVMAIRFELQGYQWPVGS